MDQFDLGRLTSYDFEAICRDLFSEILRVRLEIFTTGPDGGIDLRYITNGERAIIVQCKHWRLCSQTKLIGRLIKEELPKVARLEPRRYIIATTVSLTPEGKDKIVDSFAPYISDPKDVYGLDDIVAELRERNWLVERHFRLWLSSTAVMQTILHKTVHLRRSWMQKQMLRIAKVFVPHSGFYRAQRMVEQKRVCVILGPPGVGKTTVGLMVTAWFVGQGYEPYEIVNDFDEVLKVWDDDTPQVFFCDDFLGPTTLNQNLKKNEDRTLLSLIQETRFASNKALVMTSREYVYVDATRKHERLSDWELADAQTMVTLADMSEFGRAQMLYNHVSVSELNTEQKASFAEADAFRSIIYHRNFNPRVIGESIRLMQGRKGDASAVLKANLDDPKLIWDRILENDLSDEAVNILEALLILRPATGEELRKFWTRYREKMGADTSVRLFRRALGIIDGTMIYMDGASVLDDRFIDFDNPSIIDYMEYHLSVGRANTSALLRAVETSDQLDQLLDAMTGPDISQGRRELSRCQEHLAAAFTRSMEQGPDSFFSEEEENSVARYFAHLIEKAEAINSAELAEGILDRIADVATLEEPVGHLVHLGVVLGSSRVAPSDPSNQFVSDLKDALVDRIYTALDEGRIHDAIAIEVGYRKIANCGLDPTIRTKILDQTLGYFEYCMNAGRLGGVMNYHNDVLEYIEMEYPSLRDDPRVNFIGKELQDFRRLLDMPPPRVIREGHSEDPAIQNGIAELMSSLRDL